jgi:pyrimidine-nucleoside phosphorylase
MTLGTQMLIAGGKAGSEAEARKMLQETIDSGSALKKLAEFVKAQGGDANAIYDTGLLPRASIVEPVFIQETGYIEHIECDEVGVCSLMLGGGRETKDSEIDLSVGILLTRKVGEYVDRGDIVAYIHGNSHEKIRAARKRLLDAYTISVVKPEKPVMVKCIIS